MDTNDHAARLAALAEQVERLESLHDCNRKHIESLTNKVGRMTALSRQQPDGDWCRFEDVLALSAENADLHQQIRERDAEIARLTARCERLSIAFMPFAMDQTILEYHNAYGTPDDFCMHPQNRPRYTLGAYRAVAAALEGP